MLKYSIRKRRHWMHPLFRDNLNWGAYIVSKELNQDPDSFSWEIFSQAKTLLSRLAHSAWQLSYIPDSCSVNCTKTKFIRFVNLSCHLKKQMNHRSTLEQLALENHAATQLWKEWLSQLPVSSVTDSSICSAQSGNSCRKFRLPVSLLCPRPKCCSLSTEIDLLRMETSRVHSASLRVQTSGRKDLTAVPVLNPKFWF
jgi:hypothetical protein